MDPTGNPPLPPLRLEQRYAMVPVDLITDRTLFPIDRVLGALLADHDRGAYCCWPTNATLAAEAGCRPRQVQLSLRRLEAAGWIALEPSKSVPRGQIIRLLWRRPDNRQGHQGGGASGGRGGRTTVRGGGAPPCAQSRPRKQDPQLEARRPPEPEDDPAEQIAWAREALLRGGPLARFGRKILDSHGLDH
jgi:Helix-turn-helix domain